MSFWLFQRLKSLYSSSRMVNLYKRKRTDNIMAKRKRIKRHTMTHNTKNQATWTPLNTGRELRCSERLSRKKNKILVLQLLENVPKIYGHTLYSNYCICYVRDKYIYKIMCIHLVPQFYFILYNMTS